MNKTHKIKCIQPFYDAVLNGLKNFEIRYNDRDYKVGDEVLLMEYNPLTEIFTGKDILIRIDYLLSGSVYLKDGYCVFGFSRIFRILKGEYL